MYSEAIIWAAINQPELIEKLANTLESHIDTHPASIFSAEFKRQLNTMADEKYRDSMVLELAAG